MENKLALSKKAASKPIHLFNISLSLENKEALDAKVRELMLNNTPRTRYELISEAIEWEYHSGCDRSMIEFERIPKLIKKTTCPLTPQVLQMVFNMEGHYFLIAKGTASKIINLALTDYLKDYEMIDSFQE